MSGHISLLDEIEKLREENEKLKRIVEVLEKSNKVYASSDRWSHSRGDDPEFILWGKEEKGYEIARQAKAEVERIRGTK